MSKGEDWERRKEEMINLVFLPMPGMGHLVSMVELARNILLHHNNSKNHRFSVTVLIIPPIQPSPEISAYVASVEVASCLDISFLNLPQMDPSHIPNTTNPSQILSAVVDFFRPHIASAITALIRDSSPESTVAALVVDMFLIEIGDVAADLGVDFYMFYTSSASMFGLMLYLPTLDGGLPAGNNLFELEEDESVGIHLPGFSSPIPVTGLPDHIFERQEEHVLWLKKDGIRYRDLKGVIVNSFLELQPHSFKALKEGLYVPNHPTPPVYPVGPLLSIKSDENQQQEEQQHECIQWLNDQPPKSVVFLCFGSMGSFSKEQAREIAVGLERSGHKFLWVLRSPSAGPQKPFGQQPTDAVLDEVLPEGFLERTWETGMVWPTFAPQKEILSHDAVGGFVTHCGWNSTLESLWFGVPMLTWPLYAEQHLNAFEMVEAMEVAVGLKIDRKAGNWAVADDIERGVRRLMEEEGNKVRSKVLKIDRKAGNWAVADDIERGVRRLMEEEGNKVRSKVLEMSEMSKRTLEEGGSSFLFMESLLEAMTSKNNI